MTQLLTLTSLLMVSLFAEACGQHETSLQIADRVPAHYFECPGLVEKGVWNSPAFVFATDSDASKVPDTFFNARDFTAARSTFMIDTDGHVIYREMDVAPRTDIREVVEFLCEWTAHRDHE